MVRVRNIQIKPCDILFISIIGCTAGLSYLITSDISLAPGIQFRLFAFIAPTLGIILGKYRGGFAAALAEAVWAFTAFYALNQTYALSIATPFALIGNFFQAFIPGLLIEKYAQDHGRSISLKNLGLILTGAILGLIVLSLWFGVFFHVLNVTPYIVIIQSLWQSDFIPILLGTAPCTWITLRILQIKKNKKKSQLKE